MVMVIAILAILGLIWGSFVSALTWRLREQSELAAKKRAGGKTTKAKGKSQKQLNAANLSILKGRSMCPDCHHELSPLDLVPLLSWLALRGRCRYCKKHISVQYPLTEVAMAIIFVVSYLFWPFTFAGVASFIVFGLWLAAVVVLMALAVYDLRWRLLPDRLVATLAILAVVQAVIIIVTSSSPVNSLIDHIVAVAIGGGLFYLVFAVSQGKWIGGGDVKLGFVLGLLAGSWGGALLMLFLASLLGCIVSLPLMAIHKLNRKSAIPFGPFLILSTMIVVIWGQAIIDWYVDLFTLG